MTDVRLLSNTEYERWFARGEFWRNVGFVLGGIAAVGLLILAAVL